MLTRYMHVHLLILFCTLIGSLSNDPEFAHPDNGCFLLLIRCSMGPDMLRGFRVSLYLVWYSCLPFIPVVSIVFLFYIIASRYSIPYSYYYHVWTFICVTAMIMTYYSLFL